VNDLLAAVEVTQVFAGKIAQGSEIARGRAFQIQFSISVVGNQLSELGFTRLT